MFVLTLQTEIFDTGYCWIVHLSFLTSHNLLFFRFCKTSKKTTFSVFLSFFLVKLPKSQSLQLNISRTAWPILMILVSFCRILNGLSDEINLFWRCSSPLRQRWHRSEAKSEETYCCSVWKIYQNRRIRIAQMWVWHMEQYETFNFTCSYPEEA